MGVPIEAIRTRCRDIERCPMHAVLSDLVPNSILRSKAWLVNGGGSRGGRGACGGGSRQTAILNGEVCVCVQHATNMSRTDLHQVTWSYAWHHTAVRGFNTCMCVPCNTLTPSPTEFSSSSGVTGACLRTSKLCQCGPDAKLQSCMATHDHRTSPLWHRQRSRMHMKRLH